MYVYFVFFSFVERPSGVIFSLKSARVCSGLSIPWDTHRVTGKTDYYPIKRNKYEAGEKNHSLQDVREKRDVENKKNKNSSCENDIKKINEMKRFEKMKWKKKKQWSFIG